ncbi:PilT/PilU family type 4a pilus ATPase [Marinobacterium sediminicola]|uniref:Twitching motility protein PilU n=1 Tax=Marinobacterium sediminicola TaxID=518898 RepID=A0ABY1RVL2_9GAMM|nr:PilT/PilU family type 4a pilus ATPase [Marinobacterium sediminicola]ULG70614.1 PilT/PilU family type 4a pilus ATPase [Marinobacterium sediminicola]SMR68858.1 twitching motility protein PilU [Marinobacterium sediminicola]
MLDLHKHLQLMSKTGASDLFLSAESPIMIKTEGVIKPVDDNRLSAESITELARSLMNEPQVRQFQEELEMNFAYDLPDTGRFRVNVYRQRGNVAMVIRMIRHSIPSIESLNLPEALKQLAMLRSGLVLIVGATGSGKSTSMASMIEYRNQHASGHILTIEDPIEFLHSNKKSLINQREVGVDTLSYANALKNALREAPDVIVIGEIRDAVTTEHAVRYSETGHLCLSTLHANNSVQAIEHIANFFHDTDKHKVNNDLALNLKAIVSLRLIRDTHGHLIPATEVLINTPYIAKLIARGEYSRIREAIDQSSNSAAHTFDSNLLNLYREGRITLEEALRNADSRNNVALRLKLMAGQ